MVYELNFFSYTGIINSLGFALIGLWVFLSNPRGFVNRTFAIFNLFAFLWSFPYVFWSAATDQETAIFWLRILDVGAAFIMPAFLHFTTAFLGIYKSYMKKFFIALYIFFILFSLMFLFTDLLIKDAVKNYWPFFTPVHGPLLTLYLLFWGGIFAFGGYLMFIHYKRAQGDDKKRFLYALIAFMIGVIGGSSNFIMWYVASIPPIGNPFVFLYVVIMTFIITKYRLFDMKVIAVEVISFAMWYFLLLRFALAKTMANMFTEGFFFLGSVVFGLFLIRSARQEVKQKEQLAELNTKLNTANFQLLDLNQNL